MWPNVYHVFVTTRPPQQLWRRRSPCLRSTSLHLSGETSSGSCCGESATAKKKVRPSAGQRRPATLPLGRRPYFVVLANDDIVGVKEIWDVLLHHVVA